MKSKDEAIEVIDLGTAAAIKPSDVRIRRRLNQLHFEDDTAADSLQGESVTSRVDVSP